MKRITVILVSILFVSFIGNRVLIGKVIKDGKQNNEKLSIYEQKITDKENEFSEANIKMEELNTSIQTLNGQLEEYKKQVDDFANKECFYIEPVEESTKYVTEDTPFIDAADFNKIGRLSRGQAVRIIGQVTNNLEEGTHWYKVRLVDNSEAYVNAKYLADNKPIEVTVDNGEKATVGDGTTTGKSQEQIDFEKKAQELISSGKYKANVSIGTGGEANFDSGNGGSLILR